MRFALGILTCCLDCNSELRGPNGVQKPGGAPQQAAVATKPSADGEAEAILAGKDEDGNKAVPADEFFDEMGRKYMIWKGEPEWFKKLADDAKAAGSPGVYAVVSTLEEGGVGLCAQYIIALPADPASRGKIIESCNSFWRRGLDELSPEEREVVEGDIASELAQDRGQKYLMLSYDP